MAVPSLAPASGGDTTSVAITASTSEGDTSCLYCGSVLQGLVRCTAAQRFKFMLGFCLPQSCSCMSGSFPYSTGVVHRVTSKGLGKVLVSVSRFLYHVSQFDYPSLFLFWRCFGASVNIL